jgi:hypothetical protein
MPRSRRHASVKSPANWTCIDDVPMSDGVCALVRAVVALPRPPGHSYVGLVELVTLPDAVLELVAAEIIELYNADQLEWRPTVAELPRET